MTSLPGPASLVLKSIQRRPFRTVATVLCFIVVTSSLLSVHFLVGGAQNSVQAGIDRIGADILVVPQEYIQVSEATLLMGRPTTFKFDQDILSTIRQMEGVERAAPQLYIATLQNQGCCSTFLQLIAFEPTNDFTIIPWLNAELGRSLQKDECIVGAGIIGNTGTTLDFYGHEYTIAGRLDPTGMGMDGSVFIRMEDAYTMSEESTWKAAQPVNIQRGEISAVLVRVDPGVDRDRLATAIQQNIPGTFPYSAASMARRVNAQLGLTSETLYAIAAVTTLVSVPFMGLVSSLVANERRRELALLRAMGATKRFIFGIVIAEALVFAAIGALIGVVGTSVFLALFQPFIASNLQIPFLWPPIEELVGEMAFTVFIAIVLGVGASLYPAIRISGQDPYESIRRGEL